MIIGVYALVRWEHCLTVVRHNLFGCEEKVLTERTTYTRSQKPMIPLEHIKR